MKDFFKKLSKPQNDVEDLDTGYDSEYYAGAYDRDSRRDDRRDDRRNDRYDERRDDRYDDRRDSRDSRYDDRRDDRRDDRDYRDYRDSRNDRDDFYAPRGTWEEEVAPAYRERVEEKAEPVFTPAPAPEYLYYTPATYRDCREGIVKGLADGHVVVVRLADLEANDVLRLFDYMMGAVLALGAEIVRPEATTVVLVPDGVELDEDELDLDGDEDEEYDEEEEYEEDEEEEDAYEYEDVYEDEEYEDDEEYEEESDEDVE